MRKKLIRIIVLVLKKEVIDVKPKENKISIKERLTDFIRDFP